MRAQHAPASASHRTPCPGACEPAFGGGAHAAGVRVGAAKEHTVAFYLLDWNNDGVTQTAAAQTTGGVTLDGARPFAGLTQGVYAVYRICGSVDFVFSGTGGKHAQVSGVFFGPPSGNAVATNLLVDTAGGLSQAVAETDGQGNLTAYYVRMGDQLLSAMRPGGSPGTWTTRYDHGDGIGSVRALTDETGTTTDTRGYEAFGTKNREAGSDPLAYGFAGEPFQGDSMLAYHRARWMDARVGRFEGMDSYAEDESSPATLNRFAYGGDSPVTMKDPTGNDFGSFDVGLVADFSLRTVFAQFVTLASISVNGSFTSLPNGPTQSGPAPYGPESALTQVKVKSAWVANKARGTLSITFTLQSLQTTYYKNSDPSDANTTGHGSLGNTLGQHEDAHKQTAKEWWTDLRVKGLAAAANISFSGLATPDGQGVAVDGYIREYMDCIQQEVVDGRQNLAGCPPPFYGQ